MKHKIIIISVILGSILLLLNQYNKIHKPKYTIAIVQSASHPALDAARDGFIQTINKNFSDKEIQFLLYNTQGSLASAHSLASQLHNNKKIHMFYTIGSSVTQAVHQLEKTRPIFFAAVSDPYEIGINQQNYKNITGFSDMISPEIPLYLINSIDPKTKKIALLYSMSTLNQQECKKIRTVLENNKKEVIDIIINNETEIESILESNIEKCDAILSPCDNVVATAMPLIVKKTIKHKKPFFVCFNEAVTAGALASCGTNYYESGEKNATNAIQVIKKTKNISDMKIEISHNKKIYLNNETAQKIGIDISNISNDNIKVI